MDLPPEAATQQGTAGPDREPARRGPTIVVHDRDLPPVIPPLPNDPERHQPAQPPRPETGPRREPQQDQDQLAAIMAGIQDRYGFPARVATPPHPTGVYLDEHHRPTGEVPRGRGGTGEDLGDELGLPQQITLDDLRPAGPSTAPESFGDSGERESFRDRLGKWARSKWLWAGIITGSSINVAAAGVANTHLGMGTGEAVSFALTGASAVVDVAALGATRVFREKIEEHARVKRVVGGSQEFVDGGVIGNVIGSAVVAAVTPHMAELENWLFTTFHVGGPGAEAVVQGAVPPQGTPEQLQQLDFINKWMDNLKQLQDQYRQYQQMLQNLPKGNPAVGEYTAKAGDGAIRILQHLYNSPDQQMAWGHIVDFAKNQADYDTVVNTMGKAHPEVVKALDQIRAAGFNPHSAAGREAMTELHWAIAKGAEFVKP